MFCFVTEQQITNALPALLLNADVVVPVFTFRAFVNSWFKTFNDFLHQRKIAVATEFVFLNNGEIQAWEKANEGETNFFRISQTLKNAVSTYTNSIIYFNIGGGTKLMTIAAFELLNSLELSNFYIVYLNSLDSGVYLHKIKKYPNSEEKNIPLSSFPKPQLKIHEYLKLFFWSLEVSSREKPMGLNHHFLSNQSVRIFIEKYREAGTNPKIKNLELEINDQRHYLSDFKSEISQWLMNNFHINDELVVNNLVKSFLGLEKANTQHEIEIEKDNLLATIFPGKENLSIDKENYTTLTSPKREYKNTGFLYEEYVLHGLKKIIEDSPLVADSAENVRISREKRELAEFDFMVLTIEGRLLSFDVKTKKESTEKFYASLLKLKNLGGVYLSHYIIVPIFLEDIELEYFSAKNGPLHIIDELHRNKIPFAVYTGRSLEEDKTFFLTHKRGGQRWHRNISKDIKKENERMHESAITCVTVTSLMKKWRIL